MLKGKKDIDDSVESVESRSGEKDVKVSARAPEWVAVADWQLSWAEVKAWGPVTERTEGSSIIIKNNSSAPYCGLTASSSQAVGVFVRLLCQRGLSVFWNQCTFQLLLFEGEGDEEQKTRKKSWEKNRKVRTPPVFHLFKSAFRLSILIHVFIYQNVREIPHIKKKKKIYI